MKTKAIIMLALLLAIFSKADAHKLYDLNANIYGITGDYELLRDAGYRNSVEPNVVNIELPFIINGDGKKARFNAKSTTDAMNRMGVGKLVLDALFQRQADGTLSETMLKERAFRSASFGDKERAQVGLIDAETILREDYLPLLKNNFIFLHKTVSWKTKNGNTKSRDFWGVWHVEIDENTMNEVFNSWNSPQSYEQIQVKVKYLGGGKGTKKIVNSIAKKVPQMALKGPVVGSHPLYTDISSQSSGNRYFTYRMSQNSKGQLKSHKVSTLRETGVTKGDLLRMRTVAGGTANASKGDIVVYRPDGKNSWSFNYIWKKGSQEYSLTYDHMFSMSPGGWSYHMLVSAGYGTFKDHSTMLYPVEGNLYKSPVFFNAGLGMGLSKTFWHRVQIMPYVYFLGGEGIFTFPYEDYNKDAKMNWTQTIRFPIGPVGVRASVNLLYPLQLTGGIQYNIDEFTINMDKASAAESDGTVKTTKESGWENNVKKNILDPRGWKRSGLCFFVGLRYTF